MKFSILSLLGRPGAGKGTQVELLRGKKKFQIIHTGQLLRKRAKVEDAIGRKLKYVLEHGFLVPTPIVFSLWMPLLIKVKNNESKYQGIIFDGNPRKLYEAKMLDEVFEMFSWTKNFRVCYIHISEQEAIRRLKKRGRYDDHKKEIEERLRWFNTEVKNVLDYYAKRGVLVAIKGEQSQEDVQKEIRAKLKGRV